MTDVLTATNLRLTRGGRLVIDDLDLALPAGSTTALTGANGSGKSTLAWCLSLHDDDYAGTITLDGTPALDLSAQERRALHRTVIALQPQSLLLEDSWTVDRTLSHGAWALGIPWFRRPERVTEVVERTGIESLRRSRVGDLSGGERMRVALARTRLMASPRLVVLDEPTSGADEALTSLVLSMVRDWTQPGAAVLTVTHDIRLIDAVDQEVRLGAPERGPHDKVLTPSPEPFE